jgi:MFS superfamily sulfate permease-like transporter
LGVAIVLLLRRNRYAPAAIVLMALGIGLMFLNGDLGHLGQPELRLPALVDFSALEVWQTLLLAGFAQVPLTATNAVISTSKLVTQYWPDASVSPRRLSFSHAIMNLTAPWFGGMPMCHGAGGLVGQFFYGARTAGANIIEGSIEIVLGLFFAGSIAALFAAFPQGIVGAMMFLVGIELLKFVRHVHSRSDLGVLVVTASVALLTNMAYGYLLGVAAHHVLVFVRRRRSRG